MNDDDLRSRLDQWGDAPTPPVDGAFANRLEADLRIRAADLGQARPWYAFVLRPSVVAVALLIVAGVAGLLLFDDEPEGVIMVASEGATVSVSVPGSPTTVVGSAGLDLPEGSEVRVGPGGSAIVGGVVLPPGAVARIDDGGVELLELPPRNAVEPTVTTTTVLDVAPTTVDGDATTTIAPPTTEQPDVRPGPTVVDPDTTTDSRPSTTDGPTTLPPETTIPDTTVPPNPDRSTTTSTAAPTTTVPDAAPLAIQLTVSEPDRRQVDLVWRARSDDRIAGWVVLIRRGDTVRRQAVVRQPGVSELRVEVPGPNVEWRVRALTADGETLGQSRWVGLPG